MATDQAAVVVKAFDPASPEAREACRREVPVLMALRGSGLVPTMRGYNLENSYFATDHISGRPVDALLCDTGGAAALSRKVAERDGAEGVLLCHGASSTPRAVERAP